MASRRSASTHYRMSTGLIRTRRRKKRDTWHHFCSNFILQCLETEEKDGPEKLASTSECCLGEWSTASEGVSPEDPGIDDELQHKLRALYMDDNHQTPGDATAAPSYCGRPNGGTHQHRRTRIESVLPVTTMCHSSALLAVLARISTVEGVSELFKAATTDESLFPARYCKQPIRLG